MKILKNPILYIIIFLLAFIAIIGFLLLNAFTNIPNEISAEHMSNVLIAKGFSPKNAVDNADESLLKSGLINCIIAEKDDIKFEFYDFDNNEGALKTYREAHNLIIRTRMGVPRIQIKTGKIGYKLYTLNSEGTYSVAIYVKNTAIYAYCNSANKHLIYEILNEIGYIQTKKDNS